MAEGQHAEARVKRLEKLVHISTLIGSSLDVDTVLSQILHAAAEVMEAAGSSIMLRDAKTGDLLCQEATGRVGKQVCQVFRLPKGQGIAGWVAEHRKPVRLENVYDDPRFSPEMDKKTGFHTQSMLCVPLVAKDRLLGVAQVVNKLGRSGDEDAVITFNDEDEELFTLFGQQAAIALDNAQLHRSLLKQERLDEDLRLAREIQQSFLPPELPELPGLELGAYYEPTFQVGGDFYDHFFVDPDHLALAIGDVSGKGASAALYMARFLTDLKTRAIQQRDPAKLFEILNHNQFERSRFGMFITAIYGILDLRSYRLDYVCAGHPALYRYQPGRSCGLVPVDAGMPIGIFDDTTFALNQIMMEPGEVMVWYTDGVAEAQRSDGQLIGIDWMSEIVENESLSAQQMTHKLVDEVHRFGGQQNFYDDITVMILRRLK